MKIHGVISGAIACFVAYGKASNEFDDDGQQMNLVVGTTLIIVGLVYSAIVYYCRHKIVVAIALIKESSKWVRWKYDFDHP